jgi:hypothetical protein
MLGDRAEPEDDAGSSDDNGVVEDSNAADLRSVLEQIRLNASDKPSTWPQALPHQCAARVFSMPASKKVGVTWVRRRSPSDEPIRRRARVATRDRWRIL